MSVDSGRRNTPAGGAAGALVLVLGLGACGSLREDDGPAGAARPPTPATPATVRPGRSLSLFDGVTLGGWREAKEDDFVSHGELSVKDGSIVLGQGYPYTGIRWEGDFPRENFEVTVEAKRLKDRDIFCGLTVPVGKSNVTLVLGGWGDSVVGLSNVDHCNASENETTAGMSFKNDQWYEVRLRVTADAILAWIDGEQVVDLKREGHTFTIYEQLHVIRPLGFFTWETEAALRNINMKRLPEDP